MLRTNLVVGFGRKINFRTSKKRRRWHWTWIIVAGILPRPK